jgi:hypothetical protein
VSEINRPQTKVCSHCLTEKPFSEFYLRSNAPHTYNSWCKACMIERSKSSKKLGYNQMAFTSEQQVLSILESMGIWTVPGRAYRGLFPFVDLVAWGCVGIEIKASLVDKLGTSKFSFSSSQQKHGIRGDLVILVREFGDHNTYHIFSSNHEVFYRDGKLKSGIYHDPNVKRRRGYNRIGRRRFNLPLSTELLDQFQDAWALIEQVRLQKSEELKASDGRNNSH